MICVPYFSGSSHTAGLAEAIASGAGGARLMDITAMTDADRAALDAATLIAFGAPTYMGSTAAKFDLFLEGASSRWQDMVWVDKMAAGFTVATHPSGDKLSALMRMSVYGAQMGMIWVGQTSIGAPVFPQAKGLNTDGSWLGLMATSSCDKSELVTRHDALTAKGFGARLAGAAKRWSLGAD